MNEACWCGGVLLTHKHTLRYTVELSVSSVLRWGERERERERESSTVGPVQCTNGVRGKENKLNIQTESVRVCMQLSIDSTLSAFHYPPCNTSFCQLDKTKCSLQSPWMHTDSHCTVRGSTLCVDGLQSLDGGEGGREETIVHPPNILYLSVDIN